MKKEWFKQKADVYQDFVCSASHGCSLNPKGRKMVDHMSLTQVKLDGGCPESRLKNDVNLTFYFYLFFVFFNIFLFCFVVFLFIVFAFLFLLLFSLIFFFCVLFFLHLLLLLHRLLDSSSSSLFSSSSSSSSCSSSAPSSSSSPLLPLLFLYLCLYLFLILVVALILSLFLSRPLPLLLRTLSTKLRTAVFVLRLYYKPSTLEQNVLRLYYKPSTLELRSSGRPFAGAEHRAPDVRFRTTVVRQKVTRLSSHEVPDDRSHTSQTPRGLPLHPAITVRVVTYESKSCRNYYFSRQDAPRSR